MKNEALVECTGNGGEIRGVAGEHHVFANECSDHHRGVYDVRSPGSRARRSRGSARRLGQGLEAASGQKTRQLGLRPPSPSLREHARRNGRAKSAVERLLVECPECTVPPLRGEQRASVVRDPGHVSHSPGATFGSTLPRIGRKELIEQLIGVAKLVVREGAVLTLPGGDRSAASFERELVHRGA